MLQPRHVAYNLPRGADTVVRAVRIDANHYMVIQGLSEKLESGNF